MKKKGFTLIEILIAIAIVAIVMTALSNFFLTNYNTLNKVNKQIDLQSEGEKGIERIVRSAIESKGIIEVRIEGQDLNLEEHTIAENIDRIVFKTIDINGNDIYEIFEVADNRLWHGTVPANEENTDQTIGEVVIDKDGNLSADEIIGEIAAEDINHINLSASANKTLKDADGVEVEIHLSKGNESAVVNSEVCFRNK
ncbi:prepilin-type N-terminal cleavage/methylation domain-containing protein [Clostridium sp. ZS2-4]|uniref:prepilin-type N-terminal cleavage/methylation domain-containing protein n=1 Tax=Clostridium sp. ZS2-4 TaxID=2987703 RepID=UPI00227CEC63|nr:prepilin-type N-terminal cleavage/methylation domain-containing protein [Clostridium sp. ZS2-4]MCY6355046.1 prepilin-type N-terminal cleavage/methylation domain-containing protein [Clostridium sp. ZS2-4]